MPGSGSASFFGRTAIIDMMRAETKGSEAFTAAALFVEKRAARRLVALEGLVKELFGAPPGRRVHVAQILCRWRDSG